MDVEERLKKLVEDTGEINLVLGGYEIKVLKPILFPWYKAIKLLIEIGHEIWVNEKEGEIHINSEPRAQ